MLLAVGATLVLLQTPAVDPRGGDLWEAARLGNLERVRQLLDAGVPADAPNPQGALPLSAAASSGALEVVRLLVEKGAQIDTRDPFFNSSALENAVFNKHPSVVRFLLEKGAADADSALDDAIERGDFDQARAALATGKIERLDLLAARKAAEGKASAEMKDLLAAATPAARARTPFPAAPERLRKLAGRYRGRAGEANVAVSGSGLELQVSGQPTVDLVAVGEDWFEDITGDVGVRFGGRAGTVEGMTVNRRGDVARYGVAAGGDPAPLPKAGGESAGPASRTAARPWPSFRGEGASGNGDGQGVPTTWDLASKRNVRWKTPVPGLGNASPIVWGDRIFVATAVSAKGENSIRTGLYGDGTAVDDASEHSFRLFALDKATGRILWEREVHRGAPAARRHVKASQANSTPATDGGRVVVLFGTVGQLAAFDLDGKALWKRDVGVLDCGDPIYGGADWGHASSPFIHGEVVIVQGDRRKDSFLAAYRLSDGAETWRVAREELSTWATPNVVRGPAGDELVTNGKKIRAYDPASGQLLWTLGPNSEVVVATPVVGGGQIFVTAGYPPVRPVYAVRPGHRGDLSLPEGQTKSAAVAWSHARGGTYLPTPLLYGDQLYTVNNNGLLTSYRADTGEQVYQTRLAEGGGSFSASPVAADGRLFFPAETGEIYVLRAGPRFELLAKNEMDEIVMASPAISDGLLVVRTLAHVVGLAETAAP
jgi:outer membrane protein assembly factor BamB